LLQGEADGVVDGAGGDFVIAEERRFSRLPFLIAIRICVGLVARQDGFKARAWDSKLKFVDAKQVTGVSEESVFDIAKAKGRDRSAALLEMEITN
jgi:hypothetical protein